MCQFMQLSQKLIWEFPKVMGTSLGLPRIRTVLYWSLCWGAPISGNYYVCNLKRAGAFQQQFP